MTITRRTFLRIACLALPGAGIVPAALLAAAGEATHVVRKGNTLSAIAARYGVTVAALRQRNRLTGDVIKVGQQLVIPAAPGSRSAARTPAVLDDIIAETRKLRIRSGRWKYIVVHHSGIERGNALSYHRAHLRRGMEHGLAYHFVIGNGRDSPDGKIEIGPRWRGQLDGGHVRNHAYNQHGIGICLVGNFQNRRPGKKQLDSLYALVDWLRDDAPLGGTPSVTVHRRVDINHTVCPGRYFPFPVLKSRYA
ncbi:MAG: N-acetylmuramoyl-L-alanine amidase [Opitutaceae bacterium]|jgi:murein DD-endopeptidase MepM/ murein hydrolase activator NlpD|nr:N-acetylmuramoyl-L-alanine amidase [Opitutaceae bacterium]